MLDRRFLTMPLLMGALLGPGPALAHHALPAGATLDFPQALISGLAHPVINLDHFAFVLAIGVLAAVGQGSKWLPVWFVGGTLLGCVLAFNGLALPFADILTPVALLVLGLALALGRERITALDIGTFVVTGLLHGSVYAELIVGSVSGALAGYLLGFAIIQIAVASGAMMAAYALWRGDSLYANARIAGGLAAGVGLAMIAQSATQAFFPLA